MTDNAKLRWLLWAAHWDLQHHLYGDDGEMQCSGVDGICDFKRDSVQAIEAHLQRRAERKLVELG